ncbi:MAG: hypothetical protein ACPLUL_10030 [Thermanaerothrix sp.]|uniref:hypothetical protein n=1 Tax=Thermanaerothrix sp. TaxID=2972675 RepID=UPI003C7E281F
MNVLDALLLPFVWVLNGLLATVYLAIDHLAVVALVPLLAVLYGQMGRLAAAQASRLRAVLVAAGVLALMAALWAPQPAPYLTAALAGVGAVAIRLERYRPDDVAWEVIQNLILYALVGLGAQVLTWVLEHQNNGLFAGGVNYLAVLVGFALWGMPVAQGALLLKNLLAHAPTGGDPRTILTRARERRS